VYEPVVLRPALSAIGRRQGFRPLVWVIQDRRAVPDGSQAVARVFGMGSDRGR